MKTDQKGALLERTSELVAPDVTPKDIRTRSTSVDTLVPNQSATTTRNSSPVLKTITSKELAMTDLPSTVCLVDEMFGVGVTILAGLPKTGKSAFAFQLCGAVANGDDFMGRRTMSGDVLYIAIEDTPTRLKARMDQMGLVPSEHCHLTTEYRRIDQGLLEAIGEWIDRTPKAVLVIIDTLQWVRVPVSRMSYGNDVAEVGQIKKFAAEKGISVILLHHAKKGNSASALDKVSGTTGLTGTADTIAVLERKGGANRATLTVMGKDVPCDEIDLRFDADRLTFSVECGEQESELPADLIRLCEAIERCGGFDGTNEEFGEWLRENAGLDSVSRIKQYASQYKTQLQERGVVFDTPRRTSTTRYTTVLWTETENHP